MLWGVANVLRIDKGRDHGFRAARRSEDRCGKGRAHLLDPALPPGVIQGGEHGNISVKPDQKRGGLVVMLDDQCRAAFFQYWTNGIELAGEFGGGTDLEHDSTVD